MRHSLVLFLVVMLGYMVGCSSTPTTTQVWGHINLTDPVAKTERLSLKKKVYEFHAKGKIGGSTWTKRQEVPGEIVI